MKYGLEKPGTRRHFVSARQLLRGGRLMTESVGRFFLKKKEDCGTLSLQSAMNPNMFASVFRE